MMLPTSNAAGVVRRLDEPAAALRLAREAIAATALDLTGIRVLTEVGTGPFVLTPLIASLAGAEQVFAVTRDCRYGSAQDIIGYGRECAEQAGVAGRIEFSARPAAEHAAEAQIVTNLGFVRPIDEALISRLPVDAVVCLMWEPWELRAGEVDIDTCMRRGVPVAGTNETHPKVRTFEYLGPLAMKLLSELGIEPRRARLALIGSAPFGDSIERFLALAGATVERLPLPPAGAKLDAALGPAIEACDALVLAEHRDHRPLIGGANGIAAERIARAGIPVAHICGQLDSADRGLGNLHKRPQGSAPPGYMLVTTDYVDPRAVIDLHAAGLKVGEIMVRARRSGNDARAAVALAVASGLGLAVVD
jgi:hypothetical protein